MIKHFIQYIIALTAILLFTVTSSVFAINSYKINDFSNCNEQNSACEYQLQLLYRLIDMYNPTLTQEQKNLVCKTIMNEAESTGFDPFFISSIIAAESSFHPKAVSPCKALGLMQLTSCVYRPMNIRDPFNIQENIYAGTRFLQYLKTLFSDSNLILAAYNAGPTRVAKLGRIPRIRETLNYVKKVNALYSDLKQNFITLLGNSISKIQLCKTLKAISNPKGMPQLASYNSSSDLTNFMGSTLFICEPEQSSRIIIQA